jgi:hypothetical protein
MKQRVLKSLQDFSEGKQPPLFFNLARRNRTRA